MTKSMIYIDGEAGTTGLQIQARLKNRADIELILLNEERKNPKARQEALNSADLVVLCLPDKEAIEATQMVVNPKVKIIDASTAHRTHPDWVYGFPEYKIGQAGLISKALRVSNPGCYALTSIALLYPLVQAGLLPKDYPAVLAAVSGYSGGGKKMIGEFEDKKNPESYHLYGLNLTHKHLPEITKWSGLMNEPIFLPSVANFPQGMAVELPLSLTHLKIGASAIYESYHQHYQGILKDWGMESQVKPVSMVPSEEVMARLYPHSYQNQDILEIRLFPSQDGKRLVVIGLLDNLGKGASGQAVQNINLMLNLKG